MGTATARLSQVLRNGSFEDISKLLPYIPGNVVDINIMSILNCCFKSSDLLHLFSYMVDSKYYLSSYLYECFIITHTVRMENGIHERSESSILLHG